MALRKQEKLYPEEISGQSFSFPEIAKLFFGFFGFLVWIHGSLTLSRFSTMSMFEGVLSVMTVVTTVPMSLIMMPMVFVHGFKKLMNRGTAAMMLATCLLSFFFEIQERLERFQLRSKLLFVPFKSYCETFFIFLVGKLKIL